MKIQKRFLEKSHAALIASLKKQFEVSICQKHIIIQYTSDLSNTFFLKKISNRLEESTDIIYLPNILFSEGLDILDNVISEILNEGKKIALVVSQQMTRDESGLMRLWLKHKGNTDFNYIEYSLTENTHLPSGCFSARMNVYDLLGKLTDLDFLAVSIKK